MSGSEQPQPQQKRTAHDAVILTWVCAETGDEHYFEFDSAYSAVCWCFTNVMTHDEVKRAHNQARVVLARNLDGFREQQRAIDKPDVMREQTVIEWNGNSPRDDFVKACQTILKNA